MVVSAFLSLVGMPSPCRMIALCLHAAGLYAMPVGWTVDDHVSSVTALVGGMLLGEIIGRAWAQQDNAMNAVDTEITNRHPWSSFDPFVTFFTACVLLQLLLGPPESLAVCIAVHVVMCAGMYSLQGRARWLFICGWTCVVVCEMAAAFAFTQRWQAIHYQLSTASVCGAAALWLLTFVYLCAVAAPWNARWTMLWGISAALLYLEPPSFALYVSLWVVAAIVVAEVVANITPRLRGFHQQLSLPSLLRRLFLAFGDSAEERAYATKHFEKSHSVITASCTIAIVLETMSAACCPTIIPLVVGRIAYWFVVFALRLHTKYNVAREDKVRLFGFGLVLATLLLHAAWIG